MKLRYGKNTEIDNKRIKYIDVLRGVAMILVLIGHNDTSLTNYIYSFHMPVFFFISGLTFKNYSSTFKEFIKKRFKSLMIPYFTLALLLYFFWIPLMHFQGIVLYKEDIIRNFIGIFYCQGIANMAWGLQLWFLPCLFVTSIVFYFIARINQRFLMLILIILTSGIGFLLTDVFKTKFLWSFDIALVGVLFYGVGFLLKGKLNAYRFKIVDCIYIFIALVVFIAFNKLNGRVDMYSSQYNDIFLFIINSFLGIYIITIISKLIKHEEIIRFIGANTITILAFHIRALDFIKKAYLVFFNYPLNVNNIFNGIILVPTLQIIIVLPIIFLLKQLKIYIKQKTKKILKVEQSY